MVMDRQSWWSDATRSNVLNGKSVNASIDVAGELRIANVRFRSQRGDSAVRTRVFRWAVKGTLTSVMPRRPHVEAVTVIHSKVRIGNAMSVEAWQSCSGATRRELCVSRLGEAVEFREAGYRLTGQVR